jgi:hypothetical protein
MAKPAFIYAFDNLGPERFTELCGELLGLRYKGFGLFVLGGIGPDGGVDAELDANLGVWQPESEEALLNDVIRPGKTVIFQFKHKVVARVGGQSKARKQLLRLFKCRSNYTCELHRKLVTEKVPTDYVLVTNVEVNSNFRAEFIEQCKTENSTIEHYQVIGLDELETWVTMEPRLRHLYFPTIFGPSRFALRVEVSVGGLIHGCSYEYNGVLLSKQDDPIMFLQVAIFNVGTVTSYVTMQSVVFKTIIDGQSENLVMTHFDNEVMNRLNPGADTAVLEPGRKKVYKFGLEAFAQIFEKGKKVFVEEILVKDEIGNTYRAEIPEEVRATVFKKS